MLLKIKYLAFLSLFTLLIGCSDQKPDEVQETKWSSLAVETEKYIQNAKIESPLGTKWKIMPDSAETIVDWSLYTGSPGVVLFYLELYYATKDSSYLSEAKAGADYLISIKPDTIPSQYFNGLYDGIAGFGFTFAEIFKTTSDQKYKTAAIEIVDLLAKSAQKTTSGITWSGINDIVYGNAGIGLFMQYIHEELNLKKADSLAVLAANGLLDQAIDTLGGLRWKFKSGDNYFMDNFSHGTAGVAYFLSQTYQKTKNQKYLDAALEAADLLEKYTNEKGYVSYYSPDKEDFYYLSWCHGPPGTSRFYYSLYESTKDEKWLDKIENTANHLMNEGIESGEKPGYWNNVGKCCGAVGVAEFYLWLNQVTGNEKYIAFSKKMTQSILDKAIKDKGMIKWVQAEHRVRPEMLAAQTGLMQGSAGVGLLFLKLHAIEQNTTHKIVLPDEIKNLK